MSYSKTQIYNLALSALKLSRRISDAETETNSNEVKTLNELWSTAFVGTLQELNIDSISETVKLELIETLDDDGPWTYVYKYPSRCAFLKRITTNYRVDNSCTHENKKIAQRNGEKVIYCNREQASADIIPKDINLDDIHPSIALAIAHNLAYLSAPLITGKGAARLQREIFQQYQFSLGRAIDLDAMENENRDQPWQRSEFVAARME